MSGNGSYTPRVQAVIPSVERGIFDAHTLNVILCRHPLLRLDFEEER